MTRCDCCDLPLESCGKQAEARALAAERALNLRLLALRAWFPATYGGACGQCGERFEPGTPITSFMLRGDGGMLYRAPCCATPEETG